MKNLTKIASVALGVFLFTGSSQLFAQATSLGNLLDLVEQDLRDHPGKTWAILIREVRVQHPP